MKNIDFDLVLRLLMDYAKKELKLSDQQILEKSIIEKKDILIPISIFSSELSTLESLVKYLKENLNLRFNKISSILNRDQRTIWTTYHNSFKKYSTQLTVKNYLNAVPVSIFSDRKFSSLESIVAYLHEKLKLTFSQIALQLHRDPRTIWTVYSRYKKKNAR